MEEDDAMEIEDNLPAAPIIERKSGEFSFSINNSSTEKEASDSLTLSESTNEADKTTDIEEDTRTSEENTTKQKKDDLDIVVLDDDDDELMKGICYTLFHTVNTK